MTRRALDRYLTCDWATKALVQAYPWINGDILTDPCSGDGRMSQALAQRFGRVLTNDLDPDAPSDLHLDACDDRVYAERPDWIISNPPFTAAGEIVWRALRAEPRAGVAMLLRCTFGEPCNSSPQAPRNSRLWLPAHPPTAILMLPRISFTGDGHTDSAPCWWFLWFFADQLQRYRGIKCTGKAAAAGQMGLAL